MRSHLTVAPNQTWQSSDRRRLSAFRIVHVSDTHVVTFSTFPKYGYDRILPIGRFLVTGSKGYTRVA